MLLIAFIAVAISMIVIATCIGRLKNTIVTLEQKAEPLLTRITSLSEQVQSITHQGTQIATQVIEVSNHLATASEHFSETVAIIKNEVVELTDLVGYSAQTARDKVALVSRTIDQTNQQLIDTSLFVQKRVVEPMRQIAALMAGLRRGLEVLLAPSPKPIDRSYGDEEMFIG